MNLKKQKLVKRVSIIIGLIIVLGLSINWILKERLEIFLKEMLSQKVSEATDGFYDLKFDDLSVDLFSGELLLEGVSFVPDSVELKKLKVQNQLPKNYFKVKIGSIYFKGVNLTWRFNYKKLLFDLFEVKNANVEIYSSKLKTSESQDTASIKNLSIYDIISPYINVLSVKKINLESSNVLYFTSDGQNPVCYGLKNINFSAYHFLLNEDSEEFGKLLYSDHFNFESKGKQTLLANTQFALNTDQIRFDTKDSIIYIQDLEIVPQRKLWKKIKQIPDSYIDGRIKSVEVKGIDFRRDSAVNRLHAKSFSINNANIEYISGTRSNTDIKKKDIIENKVPNSNMPLDTLNLSWSLYSIVSPILSKVAIDEIGINSAKLKYLQVQEADTNLYVLKDFKLTALGFLVDSISDTPLNYRFLYSDNFSLEAKGIEAINIEKNYHFNVQRMALSTLEKNIRLDSIKVKPLTTKTLDDYIIGSIESINIDSLYYNKGIDAGVLEINKPKVEYVNPRNLIVKKPNSVNDSVSHFQQIEGASVWSQLSSAFNHLSVAKIELNEADIVYRDLSKSNIYKLNNLNFHASSIFINQNTVNTSSYFTATEDFKVDFSSVEGIISGGMYKLNIGKSNYSRNSGIFRVENFNLMPQPLALSKLDKYYKISTPLIDAKNMRAYLEEKIKKIEFGVLNIHSPLVEITTNRISKKSKNAIKSDNNFYPFIDIFKMDKINVSDLKMKEVNRVNSDATDFKIKLFSVNGIEWSKNNPISLNKIEILNPSISIVNNSSKKDEEIKVRDNDSKELPSFLHKGIIMREFDVRNIDVAFKSNGTSLKTDIPNLSIANFSWNSDLLSVGKLNLSKADVDIKKDSQKKAEVINLQTIEQPKTDIYDAFRKISKSFYIQQIKFDDFSFNYSHKIDNSPLKNQKLNETNLYVSDLKVNNVNKSYDVDNIKLAINKFSYPLDDGFYALNVNRILLDSKAASLDLDSIALIPAYPKEVFAYKQPKHKDWFDVTVNKLGLQGIDFYRYFRTNELHLDSVLVNRVVLKNFKNQKIPIEHNPMPMIYEGLQKLPIKISTKVINVRDFDVVYEELPKNGTIASKIFFTNMNGRIEGLTNIASYPSQMYLLKADGNLMGSGYFRANWRLPVSNNYDCFFLDARLGRFDLTELNQLVNPMAPVVIDDGIVRSVNFNIEGSSVGASVDMLMIYNDLRITIQKNSDLEDTNKLLTRIVNRVLKSDNPRKPNKKPHEVHAEVIRATDHSTFNYIWQILQPPLVESVGVSQKSQRFAKRITGLIASVKGLFGKRDKKEETETLPNK